MGKSVHLRSFQQSEIHSYPSYLRGSKFKISTFKWFMKMKCNKLKIITYPIKYLINMKLYYKYLKIINYEIIKFCMETAKVAWLCGEIDGENKNKKLSNIRFHDVLICEGICYEPHYIAIKGKSHYKYAHIIYRKWCSPCMGHVCLLNLCNSSWRGGLCNRTPCYKRKEKITPVLAYRRDFEPVGLILITML